jgi:hypothetical protein
MLTTQQLNTLRAIADRIIPADDSPSAWEAGVGDYLLKQFERDLKDAVDLYRAGLNGLDAEALLSMGASFAALSSDAKDILLRQIETGTVKASWHTDPAPFFQTVIEHVMEGYYSDSGNGGNRNHTAWDMIGFTAHRQRPHD